MGLEIKRNSENKYSLTSTISDESYHPENEWVTEDEAKIILINEAYFKFVEKVIEIDMTFPNRYYVNGRYSIDETKPSFNEWMLTTLKSKNVDEVINTKFKEVTTRLNLDFND